MRSNKPVKIFNLVDTNGGDIYYVGYNNFKSITMYNRSNLYAMAVFFLANEIKGAETI